MAGGFPWGAYSRHVYRNLVNHGMELPKLKLNKLPPKQQQDALIPCLYDYPKAHPAAAETVSTLSCLSCYRRESVPLALLELGFVIVE